MLVNYSDIALQPVNNYSKSCINIAYVGGALSLFGKVPVEIKKIM